VDVPEDRRSYYIYLTEEANAIRDQAIAIMQSVAKTMLEGCSEEEVLVFRKVLLNIYEKL
jgi:DNA-binding MarR family transcriptional regulator